MKVGSIASDISVEIHVPYFRHILQSVPVGSRARMEGAIRPEDLWQSGCFWPILLKKSEFQGVRRRR